MSRSDSWLADLNDAVSSFSIVPTSTSPMTASPALSASGVSVGSGEYAGGGAKRAHLFCFDQLTADANKFCLGIIGEGKRFCIKTVTTTDAKGVGTCGTKTHTTKFKPDVNMFFTRAGDAAAYCRPAFPLALVTKDELLLLKSMKKTIVEWSTFFETKATSDRDGSLKPQIQHAVEATVALKTPAPVKRSSMESKVELPVPFKIFSEALEQSGEELPWLRETEAALLPPSLIEFLRNTHMFLANYSSWWEGPLLRVGDKIDLVHEDLASLKFICDRLRCDLGKPVSINGVDFPDVWCALEFLGSSLQELSLLRRDLADVVNTIATFQLKMTDSDHVLEQMELLQVTIEQHDDRFDALKPFFVQVKELNNNYQALAEKLNKVGSRSTSFGRLPSSVYKDESAISEAALPGSGDVHARLNAIMKQLSHLEKRVVGEGVSIGSFVFQSFDDVRQWTTEHLPSCRFGLFVDVVSLLSFLSSGHALETETMTVLHNSSKNGFKTMRETRVAASMQNLLPTIFGKGAADGLDTSNTLPGISTPERWDKNGVTGLRHQIERELDNVDTQFNQAITTGLEDYPEARQLAKECLYRSKKFAIEICNYLSNERAFWVDKGYTEKQAHELACTSVRRIFEDIYLVRVVARDSRDLEDPTYSCALILWATFRAHKVMEEYSRRHVKEHPSISAVIARHLATHHTKPTKGDGPSASDLKKLEQRMDILQRQYDRLDSRIATLEAKNGLAPPNDNGRRRGRNRNKKDDDDSEAGG